MEIVVKRQTKRTITMPAAKMALIARTKEHFVFGAQGVPLYGHPSSVEVRLTPQELGELLDRWDVVKLIRGGGGI